jgi:hypothetical protein
LPSARRYRPARRLLEREGAAPRPHAHQQAIAARHRPQRAGHQPLISKGRRGSCASPRHARRARARPNCAA